MVLVHHEAYMECFSRITIVAITVYVYVNNY